MENLKKELEPPIDDTEPNWQEIIVDKEKTEYLRSELNLAPDIAKKAGKYLQEKRKQRLDSFYRAMDRVRVLQNATVVKRCKEGSK